MWYTEDSGNLGPVFGAADNWKGMGLFFDSYDNDGEVCFNYNLRPKCHGWHVVLEYLSLLRRKESYRSQEQWCNLAMLINVAKFWLQFSPVGIKLLQIVVAMILCHAGLS